MLTIAVGGGHMDALYRMNFLFPLLFMAVLFLAITYCYGGQGLGEYDTLCSDRFSGERKGRKLEIGVCSMKHEALKA
jgi:hypothetical protein